MTVREQWDKVPCVHCDGTGRLLEVRRYRQPPPGDAVFEKRYMPAPDSTIVEVETQRTCVRCGGAGVVRA